MAASKAVLQNLYRSLLRISSLFDKSPSAKSIIYLKHQVKDEVNSDGVGQYYSSIVKEYIKNRLFYHPSLSSSDSMHDFVKKQFRQQNPSIVLSDRIDAGFGFLRKLTSLRASYESHARGLVAKVAPLNVPFPVVTLAEAPLSGVLLVSHPMVQGPLQRSVILILDHSETGSYGLVINRPTNHSVKTAVANLPVELLKHFGDSNVSFGGMVRRMQYLHSIPSCGGTPIPFCKRPLFAGGSITKALSTVRKNADLVTHFNFFVGCCTWESRQLEEEIKNGFWITVKSSPDVLLSMCKPTSNASENSDEPITEDNIATPSSVAQQSSSPLSRMVADIFKASNASMEETLKPFTDASQLMTPSLVEDSSDAPLQLDPMTSMRAVKMEKSSHRFDLAVGSDGVASGSESVWERVIEALGEPYRGIAGTPPTCTYQTVESCDWQ
jgi:putative transcriptional regulator